MFTKQHKKQLTATSTPSSAEKTPKFSYFTNALFISILYLFTPKGDFPNTTNQLILLSKSTGFGQQGSLFSPPKRAFRH